MNIRVSFKTDNGRSREHNEDNFLVMTDLDNPGRAYTSDAVIVGPKGVVFAVADGMGGSNAGEVASMEVIASLESHLKGLGLSLENDVNGIRDQIREMFSKAQSRLIDLCRADTSFSGMGTTLVMGWVIGSRLYMGWLGDSRGYMYRRDGNLYHITRDHSYVQELLDAGKITRQQAFYHPESNIITRSLGDFGGKGREPEIAVYNLKQGDRVLLCSDGLNSMLMDGEIADILSAEGDLRTCTDRCIDAANERGGHDNITVILLDIESVDTLDPSDAGNEDAMRLAYGTSLNQGNPLVVPEVRTSPHIRHADSRSRFTESWMLYTLLSLVLLSVGFLAGRITMKSEMEIRSSPSVGKKKERSDTGNSPVEVAASPVLDTSVIRPHAKDHPAYEVIKEDEQVNDKRKIEVMKKKSDSDSLPRRVKDTVKRVLTPIETI